MLLNFSISNFLSFNEKQTFSMQANKARKHNKRIYTNSKLKLTKCNAIYGANGAGKSNLIQAFQFVQNLVTDEFPFGFSQKYFRQNLEAIKRPSEFEIEFLYDNQIYKYSFSLCLNTGTILHENLSLLSANFAEKNLYMRDTQEKTFIVGSYFKSKECIGRLETYGFDSLENDDILFLNEINTNKLNLYKQYPELSVLRNAYKWFDKLNISFPDRILTGYPYLSDSNLEEITTLLNALGTGIQHSSIVEVPLDTVKNKIPDKLLSEITSDLEKSNIKAKKAETYIKPAIIARAYKEFYTFEIDLEDNITVTTIEFGHENNTFFSLKEESDGTVRLLDLIKILLNKSENQVFLIDEIDRCLHPALTNKLIELFLAKAEQTNTQLIITCHESRLLASEILRNDEITFIVKDSTGQSIINPLEKYQLRADKKIYAALFDGTLDGIPQFNDAILDNMQNNNEVTE